MNKQRRKQLDEVNETVRNLIGQLGDAKSQLESLRDEEQDYYDNMPENMQSGDNGSKAENAVSEMDSAIDAIDEALDRLGDVDSNISSAQE